MPTLAPASKSTPASSSIPAATPAGTAVQVGVCLASLSFYPLYAGPALRFQRYAAGLQTRGAQLQVFTQAVTPALIHRDGWVGPGSPPEEGAEFPDFELVDGLPVRRTVLPAGWRREPAYFQRLAGFCRQQDGKVEVVQLLNADFLAAPWLLQLRRQGLGTVFTHTLLADLAPAGWKRAVQQLHRRVPLELVDVVVVSSEAMRRHLLELNTSTPIEIIPNGVDLNRFHPLEDPSKKTALRAQLGMDPDWRVVLAVGPVLPRKGTETLVEAFAGLHAEFPNARLVLVGPRHDLSRESLADFHRRIQTAIRDAGAREKVIFTGAVDNVRDYFQAADMLVFPSRREGMPNVVPEAMASGLPVLMTPFTGLPMEFGRAGSHYLLTDWAPERMREDLRRLLVDPGLRRQLGSEARRWIAAQMDLERSLDAYMDLYLRLRKKRR